MSAAAVIIGLLAGAAAIWRRGLEELPPEGEGAEDKKAGEAEPLAAPPAAFPAAPPVDESHLNRLDSVYRRIIMNEWYALPMAEKVEIVRNEFGLPRGLFKNMPVFPPPLWVGHLARLLDELKLAYPEMTDRHEMLAEAGRLRNLGDAFSALRAHNIAADCYYKSASIYERLARGEMSLEIVSDVLDEAAVAARKADNDGFAVVLEKARRRIDLTRAIFVNYDEIPADAVDRIRAAFGASDRIEVARLLAERFIESPELGEMAYVVDDGMVGRESRLFLAPAFKEAARQAAAEVSHGLLPQWRNQILEYLNANEDPSYRALQGEDWYDELQNDEAKRVARALLERLDDPAFKEMYLRNGFVSLGGIQAYLEEERARVHAAPDRKEMAAVPQPQPRSQDLAVDLTEKAIADAWRRHGRLAEISAALAAGEPVAEIGDELIPLRWIAERFPADIVEAVKLRSAARELLAEWRALSPGERRSLLAEGEGAAIIIEGEKIAANWAFARMRPEAPAAEPAKASRQRRRAKAADPLKTSKR